MADVYDDMPPLVERPPPPPSFILPPIDDKFNDDDLPPLVERPAITDADLPPLVVNPKSQSRWEYISDEPLEPASGPVRTTKEKDTATSAGPPKPPNAFILFRASFVKANPVPREAERDHATLSKIIGLVWRGLDSDEKVKWEKRAGQAREEWRAKNPDWRFSKAGNGFGGGGGNGKAGGGGSGGGGTKAKGTRKKKKGPQKERCEAIAGLIQQGIKDGELANAIQNWDAVASPSPPPVEAPRKKPKSKARMAPYVRMLSFDEEVKPEPVDSPVKPNNPLPTVYRESPGPVPEVVASTGQNYSYGTNVSGDLGSQYQSLQGYQFGSFSVHSSPATSALAVEPGSPVPVNNAYVPTSPLANAYNSPAPVNYDTSSFPTADANGYADAYHADRRSSYSSTFSGQDTPVTPNFFGSQDQAAYSAGYGGYNGNGYQQTIASNYAYSAVSPPGSPAAFALPDSALGHTSSYSTLSGWNGAPAPTDANTGVQTANTYYTGVFNANPHSTQPPAQPQAQAYGGVFSAKNVDPTTFTAKPIEPVMLPTKSAEPAVYDAGAKSLAYPVYQAPYDAGVHNWCPPGAAWANVGYAYA